MINEESASSLNISDNYKQNILIKSREALLMCKQLLNDNHD